MHMHIRVDQRFSRDFVGERCCSLTCAVLPDAYQESPRPSGSLQPVGVPCNMTDKAATTPAAEQKKARHDPPFPFLIEAKYHAEGDY